MWFVLCVFALIYVVIPAIMISKEDRQKKNERYVWKPSGGWAAKPQDPDYRMKHSFRDYSKSHMGDPRKPTERERFEYGMTHMGYYPPYCNRQHAHCRSCGLCRGDGTKDCRGYSVVNGLGYFPPSECLNCSHRIQHSEDPFWDCGHPQARHVMRDAEMGLGICRPMFGPGVMCPFKSSSPGYFSDDWYKAKERFYAWVDLMEKYIEDVEEIMNNEIVWNEPTRPPAVAQDPIARSRYESQRIAAMNGVKQMNRRR